MRLFEVAREKLRELEQELLEEDLVEIIRHGARRFGRALLSNKVSALFSLGIGFLAWAIFDRGDWGWNYRITWLLAGTILSAAAIAFTVQGRRIIDDALDLVNRA